MNREIDIKLYGPLTAESGLRPELGDSVAVLTENGRVRITQVTGMGNTPDDTILYTANGGMVMASDCYLLYSSDATSVGENLNTDG